MLACVCPRCEAVTNLPEDLALLLKKTAAGAPLMEWTECPIDLTCSGCGKQFRGVEAVRVDLRQEKYFTDAVQSEIWFRVAREPVKIADPDTDLTASALPTES